MVSRQGSDLMNIAYWDYNFDTSSIDIYVSGCKEPHCLGCHNSELWDFEVGKPYDGFLKDILQKIEMYEGMIDNISIMGGEPLDQDSSDLFDLMSWLDTVKSPKTKIWLYTRYPFKEVPDIFKSIADYVKCGMYNENKLNTEGKRQYGIKLASTNQKIYKQGVDYNV
jgi:anaerobic ribonucleoside-triphosphate reductase activating protein